MRPLDEEVVMAARAWLGTPYRHQASALGAGCDCLGLVRGVWRMVRGEEPESIPPYGADLRDPLHKGALLSAAGRWLVVRETMVPGCVLLFRLKRMAEPRHCGVLVAPGRFVHAQEGLGVVEAGLEDGWGARVSHVFGFPGD